MNSFKDRRLLCMLGVCLLIISSSYAHANSQHIHIYQQDNKMMIEITWDNAASVELQCFDVQKKSPNQITFKFKDSFANTGTGEIILLENKRHLKLVAKEIMDERAARQYGTYALD